MASISSVSGGIDCELSASTHYFEELEYRQSTCCKEIVDVTLEDFGKSSASEEIVAVAQTGITFGDLQNFQECKFHKPIPLPRSHPDEASPTLSGEIIIRHEFTQSVSLEADVWKTFNKSRTFPLIKEMCTHPSSHGYKEPGTSIEDQDSTAGGSVVCARSMYLSLHSTALTSAMKGSRVQNRATAWKSDLRVKWAPDVYDPPVTIVSHTVKADNNHRPKSKKDKHKQQHKGAKSSRRNASENKHTKHISPDKMSEPLHVRSQADGGKQVSDGFDKCNVVDILEYGISSKESKCGSSFLREALPKVYLPMGEAS